jgi:crotonobetainyl-CoA:carnitine CoA-transferase CaiB-like acyl-CoA transferase
MSSELMALAGLRVLDLTQNWAGPYATKYLGDFGAEVIKVEAPSRPDPFRGYSIAPDQERQWERSPLFFEYNADKLSLCLELAHPAGLAVFKRLVAVSDVVVENATEGVMEKLGLGYDVLRDAKPDIVYVSMKAFGTGGPYARFRVMGLSMETMAGLSWVTGYREGVPTRLGVSYGDPVAGFAGALAILAAIYHRDQTGEGQYVELSATENITGFLPEPILDVQMNGRDGDRIGNEDAAMAPCGCYPARGKDRWITIAASTDAEWDGLVAAMGSPGWTHESAFATSLSRHANRCALDAHVAEWTRERDAAETMRLLQSAGVAAGVVYTAEDLLADEHLLAREALTPVSHPLAGTHVSRNVGWKMSGTPGAIRRPAPLLGQHNSELLARLLGMSPEEIRLLEEQGVLATEPTLFLRT